MSNPSSTPLNNQSLGGMLVRLGFNIDASKLEEFQKKVETLRHSALKIGTIATGAAFGLGLLVKKVSGSMAELHRFAEVNQVSARAVAALGKVAMDHGGSMEGVQSTILSLNKTIGEAQLGIGRGAVTFAKLGLSARKASGEVKDCDDILADVSTRMQTMSRQGQIAMGGKLGVAVEMIPVLAQGPQNFARLRAEALQMNPFTEKDYKLAREVDLLFIKAKNSLGMLTKQLGASLLPIVKKVLTAYLDWFKASRKVTSGPFLKAIKLMSAALSTLWDWVVRIQHAFEWVYKGIQQFTLASWLAGGAIGVLISYQAGLFFIKLGAAIKGAAKALLLFNGALLPVALLGALGIVLALLVDDIVNFCEGNESLIGYFAEKFPHAIESLCFWLGVLGLEFVALRAKAIASLLSMAQNFVLLKLKAIPAMWAMAASWIKSCAAMAVASWGALAPMLPYLAAIAAIGAAIWLLRRHWETVSTFIQKAWKNCTEQVKGTWNDVTDSIAGAMDRTIDSVIGRIEEAIRWITGLFDTVKQKIKGASETITDALGPVGRLFKSEGNKGFNVKFAPVAAALLQAPALSGHAAGTFTPSLAPMMASGGVIGHAAQMNSSNQSTVHHTNQVIGTTIHVSSPNPERAGESVRAVLNKMNRQVARNGEKAAVL